MAFPGSRPPVPDGLRADYKQNADQAILLRPAKAIVTSSENSRCFSASRLSTSQGHRLTHRVPPPGELSEVSSQPQREIHPSAAGVATARQGTGKMEGSFPRRSRPAKP